MGACLPQLGDCLYRCGAGKCSICILLHCWRAGCTWRTTLRRKICLSPHPPPTDGEGGHRHAWLGDLKGCNIYVAGSRFRGPSPSPLGGGSQIHGLTPVVVAAACCWGCCCCCCGRAAAAYSLTARGQPMKINGFQWKTIDS